MPGCSAVGCSNRSEYGFCLKVFPRDPVRRAIWAEMVNRKNWTPKDTSYLCEVRPGTSQDDIKSKINGLRTQFMAERNKLRKGKKSGAGTDDIPKPTLWRNNALMFLEKHSMPRQSVSNLEVTNGDGSRSSCEEHFEEDQWEVPRVDGKKKLKFHAIPTIFDDVEKRKKKGGSGRRRKQLKTEEDEVIEFIEKLDARKLHPQCVVCCRPLVNEKKEYLSTLMSTSGLSLHECLIGISGDKPTKIQSCTSNDMVCFYCAHLLNYADKLEAELSKLKAAINGCLEINCLADEDKDMMKTEFNSHIATLDEYGDRVVGPGSAADRQAALSENPGSGLNGIVIQEVLNVLDIQKPGVVKGKLVKSKSKNSVEKKVQLDKHNETVVSAPLNVDLPVLKCKICHLKTTSRSVLLFHLRRHMADYQWCDFCDTPIFDEENEGLKSNMKSDPK